MMVLQFIGSMLLAALLFALIVLAFAAVITVAAFVLGFGGWIAGNVINWLDRKAGWY